MVLSALEAGLILDHKHEQQQTSNCVASHAALVQLQQRSLQKNSQMSNAIETIYIWF